MYESFEYRSMFYLFALKIEFVNNFGGIVS